MRRIIIAAAAAVVITAGAAAGAVAGCASRGVTGGGGTGPRAASCGSAVTHGVSASTLVLSARPASSLRCFSAAARHCTAVGLHVTEMGTDTGISDVFTITPGSRCAVTEASQSYSANFGGSTGTVQTTHCRVAAVASKGVMLSCAGQPILIPAAVASPA